MFVVDLPPSIPEQARECIIRASAEYHVPPVALAAIMVKEGGKVGTVSRNSNGTVDYGPMQINSTWLKKLQPYGVTPWHLTYDLCTNIRAGAWRLRSEIVVAKGDFWRGVGNYHSRTSLHHEKYKRDIITIIARWMPADERAKFIRKG